MLPEKNIKGANPHKKGRFAIIIPVYNNEKKVVMVIEKCLKLDMPIFVVDDGSTDSTFAKVRNIDGISALRHRQNQGKGAALLTGFAEASKVAEWAITIDADGQHNPEDTIGMIRSIPKNERPILVGMRQGMERRNVPWTSRFGRKFSNFWVLLSGGPRLKDSQCGFRIYPVPEAMGLGVIAKRFQFEIEILVKAAWKKVPIIEAPVSVSYAPGRERESHFRPCLDFFRNTTTFARLIVQRLFIPPFIRKRRLPQVCVIDSH